MSVQQGTVGVPSPQEVLSGDYSPQSLERIIKTRDDSFEVELCSHRIVSRFQRIFSSTLQRGVGFEAFCLGINPQDGSVTPSAQLFSKLCGPDELELADRIRLFLHLKNFQAAGIEDRWIFTNLHPRVMLGRKEPDPTFLEAALKHTGLSPQQVVVALREHSPGRQTQLVKVMSILRELGCLVVFDDFLSESANLNSLWALRPDIVKLNRNWIQNAKQSLRAKRMLNKFVSLVHAAGALVIFEEIETEEEAFMAMRLEADFVQGRFWGSFDSKPKRRGDESTGDLIDRSFADLLKRSETAVIQDQRQCNFEMGCFSGDLMECAWALQDGVSLPVAARNLLRIPRVERVYLLNHRGVQTEADLLHLRGDVALDPRYKPLWDSTGATWTRRSCFHDATLHPGEVQLSLPYRSNATRNICSTLSVTVTIQEVRHVLCCDVEWREGVVL